MTELSFLIQLLLNEKLPLEIKKEVAERIKEVEAKLQPMNGPHYGFGLPASGASPVPMYGDKLAQAPSTQKILDEMAMHPIPVAPPQPASAAAAQALQARNEAIRIATSGKTEAGRNSPRKF